MIIRLASRVVRRILRVAVGLLIVGAVLVWVGARVWPGSPVPTGTPGPASTAVVVRILDGDTLDVRVGGVVQRVRVLGIDAPETAHDGTPAQCGAVDATVALAGLVPAGTPVTLVQDPRSDPADVYGRWLRYVEVAGTDVGAELVHQGLAEAWYPAGEPVPARYPGYLVTTTTARVTGTGSWGVCGTVGR